MVMRLFYQSFGVSRGSRDGCYGQVLKRILDQAAAPETEIFINGLSPHHAIAEQYRYLEFLDTADVMENGLRAEREGYDALDIEAGAAELGVFHRLSEPVRVSCEVRHDIRREEFVSLDVVPVVAVDQQVHTGILIFADK